MVRALIVYASLTGNTEEGAEVLEEAFESLDVEVELLESTFADPEDFLDADIIIVGTYTYGTDANIPDEIIDFYEELVDIDLTGKIFGTFGSGDTFYDQFCQSVLDFDHQLEKTGATRGTPPLLYNLAPDADDIDALNKMAVTLYQHYQSHK